MSHGNFTTISHEISNHFTLIEPCDIKECDHLRQLCVFNVPENSFFVDVKHFHKHINKKNVAMLVLKKMYTEFKIDNDYCISDNEGNGCDEKNLLCPLHIRL